MALPSLRVVRALIALMRNPTETHHVFTIIEGMTGDTHRRLAKRLRATPEGSRLLAERPDILPRLADRPALSALPDGSLGRAYLDFLDREQIDAEGLVAASDAGESAAHRTRSEEEVWVANRMRDIHDLWHVLTGLQGDVSGEASILAFTTAQTGHKGSLLMALVAVLKARNPDVARRVATAWLSGKRAAFLLGFRFEDHLASPLDEVRQALGIEPQAPYRRLRPDWTLDAA